MDIETMLRVIGGKQFSPNEVICDGLIYKFVKAEYVVAVRNPKNRKEIPISMYHFAPLNTYAREYINKQLK